MEFNARNRSIAEYRAQSKWQQVAIAGLVLICLLLAIKLVLQTDIIVEETPGMPDHAVIEKGAMDKGAQHATLSAVTAGLAQLNPGNAEYTKAFLRSFLAPAEYTRISQTIDAKVKRLTEQHELGSYYWIERGYEYDPVSKKWFIYGEWHTVNAARDTQEPYIFEYATHIENYRLWVDDTQSYTGDRVHDAEWLKTSKK